jgi:hypothetical protein
MRNQQSATRANQARRGWLGAIVGGAAAMLGRKLVRPDAHASSTPGVPPAWGTSHAGVRSSDAPAPVVKSAPNTVKRHG